MCRLRIAEILPVDLQRHRRVAVDNEAIGVVGREHAAPRGTAEGLVSEAWQ